MFDQIAGFEPRVVNGVLELPVNYLRGGTSTGAVLWAERPTAASAR